MLVVGGRLRRVWLERRGWRKRERAHIEVCAKDRQQALVLNDSTSCVPRRTVTSGALAIASRTSTSGVSGKTEGGAPIRVSIAPTVVLVHAARGTDVTCSSVTKPPMP